MSEAVENLLWWVIPGELAGMPMPFIHPERRLNGGGALEDFDDELKDLQRLGVRAVISLLNLPSDEPIYESVGFSYLCLPVANGRAPTVEQVTDCVRFIDEQRTARRPVAVHCEGGIGRTGTMLAAYFISQGASANEAMRRVRVVEPAAIETAEQILFLSGFAAQKEVANE